MTRDAKVYARGEVRHRDHKTIDLADCLYEQRALCAARAADYASRLTRRCPGSNPPLRTSLGRPENWQAMISRCFGVKSVGKRLAIFMDLHFDIPESITSSLRLPEPEMEPRLRTELGVALYAQSILPFGKASELAGISRNDFAALLGQREIPRHYSEQELAQDLEYARG
jgi:predicted HTH domain antitoxin